MASAHNGILRVACNAESLQRRVSAAAFTILLSQEIKISVKAEAHVMVLRTANSLRPRPHPSRTHTHTHGHTDNQNLNVLIGGVGRKTLTFDVRREKW